MMSRMWRAGLPAILAIAYLFVAAMPCPPGAELRAAASHGSHEHSGAATTSLTAPCPCGCDPGTASSGVAKRGEAAVSLSPSSPLLDLARSFAREDGGRLPAAPISVDSPVPIAA